MPMTDSIQRREFLRNATIAVASGLAADRLASASTESPVEVRMTPLTSGVTMYEFLSERQTSIVTVVWNGL